MYCRIKSHTWLELKLIRVGISFHHFLVPILFGAKGFWCHRMERASGSDGILNFKSPKGFKSEIEPWPFPSRRLSVSLIGLVLWSWERVGKALSSLGFIADVLASNIKCASNNFTSRLTIETREDSSILWVPRHYKCGRSYVLITISTAGDTSKFNRVSLFFRYKLYINII